MTHDPLAHPLGEDWEIVDDQTQAHAAAPLAQDAAPGAATLMGMVDISKDTLARLLCLPAGASLDFIQERIDQPGVLRARIRGFGHPVRHGDIIPPVTAVVSVEGMDPDAPIVRVRWHTPSTAYHHPNPCTCLTPSGRQHCPEHATNAAPKDAAP